MKTTISLILSLFISFTAMSQQTHHGDVAANGSLYFRAEPVNNFLPDKEGNLYYYVHLEGLKKVAGAAKERVPMNISIVLDRSGSMDGDKLSYAKEALKYVIKQLGSQDVLSIVLYDTGVEVFLQPQRLEDKNALLKRVDKIVTLGSTNLEGGIRKGYELVKTAKKLIGSDMVNRVLLLSDGHANVGISDPEQLAAITRDFFEKEHISISTFGVGSDYNENLMAKMALHGGGMYYFIQHPEKLPSMFDEELKGMSHVIAKNTSLKIKFPVETLTYVRTYAFASHIVGNILELQFADLFAEEQKSILICFSTKGKLKAPISIEAELSYSNANMEPMIAMVDTRKSELKIAANDTEYAGGYNRAASEGYAHEITAELYEEAVKLTEVERYADAKIKVKDARDILAIHFTKIGEHPFLREFDTKLSEYTLIIDDMKNMDRETKSYSIKMQKHSHFKRQVRSKF